MKRFIQCASTFFVSVAAILGTGILGLPVKLSRSGLAPFLLTFSGCFALQLAAVWLMTDLLQYAHVAVDTMIFKRAEAAEEELAGRSLGRRGGSRRRGGAAQQKQRQQQ